MIVVIAIAVVIPIMAVRTVVVAIVVTVFVIAMVVAVIGADDAARQRDDTRGQNAGCQDIQWFHEVSRKEGRRLRSAMRRGGVMVGFASSVPEHWTIAVEGVSAC